ncbi:TetR/AcrR family transcriptional regulator [Hoeflea poritis]|uniref:TetR/AcrR family transcriptional regulator n=1 Tax=Hoeflea poritis TaxID=2993659 RepID=A0ABT4VT88_9HYPH|nr:TetR/AcrR family transcriptional regulator [Hoeflea poritis]MDA4847824.1 TetR/AcrR family transcriptional regulator [Hoeflea poritis]
MPKPAARPVTRDPEKKSKIILKAARKEFASAGFDGARVDRIAAKSKHSKGLIYHHFQSKDELFRSVLVQMYQELSEENKELFLEEFEPQAGVIRLIEHTFDYFANNPDFIILINAENLMKAQHLRKSEDVRKSFEPLRASLDALLKKGAQQGIFRPNVDSTELYISIVALGYFYLSNMHTLSVVFDKALGDEKAIAARKQHIKELVLGFLRNKEPDT